MSDNQLRMTLYTMQFININKEKKEHYIFDKKGETNVVFFHNLSGKLSFEIKSSGVKLYIFGLYTGKNTDEYHIKTVQHHRAPDSSSDLLIKGVFQDHTKFIYQGLIRLEKEAQRSHAYQKNQNLLVSKGVFVDSRPYLEILANDVFCTHGSTTGKLNKEALLYVQTRGLTRGQAKEVLVEGFIQELFQNIQQKYPAWQA